MRKLAADVDVRVFFQDCNDVDSASVSHFKENVVWHSIIERKRRWEASEPQASIIPVLTHDPGDSARSMPTGRNDLGDTKTAGSVSNAGAGREISTCGEQLYLKS